MSDTKPTRLRVLGISGSLRAGSYNSAALRAAGELTPEGMAMETFDLAGIPLYNEDVRERGFPEAVDGLRQRIREAQALLIVTPEYNYSVPGVLKNAIDWASRPPDQPFHGKPIAIMGASPSFVGTARAQYHLRQSFIYLNGMVLNQPEVMITNAPAKFNEQLELRDQATREHIGKLLMALGDWTEKINQK